MENGNIDDNLRKQFDEIINQLVDQYQQINHFAKYLDTFNQFVRQLLAAITPGST